MINALAAAERPTGIPTRALSNSILWLAVFLGGFVFFEPSPYDLFLAALIPAWLLIGLAVPRAASPLVVLMLLFVAGGVLAATQAEDFATQPLYYAVTAFLAFSSCFFACLVAEDRSRADTIVDAWIATALVTTLLGVAGYFGLTGELFTKFDRASGGFQDPNVFGPFLILPFAVLLRRVLSGSPGTAFVNAALALVILLGLFLSFSRAAWGLAVITVMLMGALIFATERSHAARVRFVVLSALGAVVAVAMIAAALSIPAVSDLFQDRAQIVQAYDAGHLGRFQRYGIGFNMMLDHPLGIGAIEFGRHFSEDEHNIWLKTLTTYGWLGFAAWLTLVLWTLVAAFPLVFRSGPLQPVMQIAYVVFFGHIVIATVIDVDHWRHLFLLFGLLWGGIAADRAATQARLGAHFGRRPAALPRH
ncbi:MAG: O-antigen ligase family protein [Propylenella sp.]